jgi:N-acetyl-gamma-glutamyl-phosphate reductase
MARVAVLGATGYSALELFKILVRHPHIEITAATTRSDDRPRLDEVHPVLAGRVDLVCENLSPAEVASRADIVFCCLPHGVTAEVVPDLLAGGARVIDLSADYRLKDPAAYAKAYGHAHPDTAGLAEAVYGLPELYRDQIKKARLIANPGCYPTSAILPLQPLLEGGWVKPTDIIIDSKSGVSGAGRNPTPKNIFVEVNENVSAYNTGTHRHEPEIEQVLTDKSGQSVDVLFSPHLMPMDRGILSTIYAAPAREASADELLEVLKTRYRNEPFVRVSKTAPTTKQTSHTNYCDMTVRVVGGRVVLISAEDNLIKGAAGQAVQNMNLLCDWPETTGLLG